MFSHSACKNPSFPQTPPLRFPQKLWKIANECRSGAVSWSPNGKSVLLRYSLFREEFMSMKSDFFKTDNISSFVRQLNLYGFRKIYDNAHKQAYKENLDLHEFSNTCFQRDRPDLLDKVTRKARALTDRTNFSPESPKSVEAAGDRAKFSYNFFDRKDHSYLCIRSTKKGSLLYKKLNEKPKVDPDINEVQHKFEALNPFRENEVLDIQDLLKAFFPFKENTAPSIQCQTNALPVKKKRGRKPGRKHKSNGNCYLHEVKQEIDYTAILQNPEKLIALLFFRDSDNDKIFLRHTSRDMLLSSTLPFEEMPEYRLLKDTHDRLYNPNKKLRRC